MSRDYHHFDPIISPETMEIISRGFRDPVVAERIDNQLALDEKDIELRATEPRWAVLFYVNSPFNKDDTPPPQTNFHTMRGH